MTIITLHHLVSVIVWIRRWLFWTSVFFWGSEKYLGPKQSPPISHNDLKKDGAQSPGVGGALPKNMWWVCAATLTPFSNPLSLNDPFLFFTFCSHLMNPIFKMLSHLMTPFFRNIYRWKWASCSHWMMPIFTNKWPPRNMYPIFVWKEGFM